ncbi:lasso peptide biosynthesis B2 protein [Kitasatospora sp. NPDC088783]|uniref:lasso peptide biosynthesis B2 protein n=1 Tax=Kitasatospora sp. NPDC088783 TaxID=3364077 RepID=UPI00380D9D6C
MSALAAARAADGSLAVLDTRRGRGRWRALDPVGAHAHHHFTTTSDPRGAIDVLVDHWSATGADPDRIRADMTALHASLAAADLLHPAPTPEHRPDKEVLFAARRPLRPTDRIAAAAAFALAVTLLRCLPLRAALAVARCATRLPGRPSATGAARNLAQAVHQTGRWWPGRSACLEESLATFLAAALTGRRLTWVLGARFAPHGFHAWTETSDAIIGQDESDRAWPYRAALRIEHP